MFTFLLFFFSLINVSFAERCSLFEECGGSGQGPTTALPSPGNAANLNPSSLAHVNSLIKAEILYRSNNKVQVNLLSGSNDVGGGLIGPEAENAFFGNRSIEMDQDTTNRSNDNKNYESKKIHFATGFSLINSENFGIDMGANIRRNPDVKKVNLGAGSSMRIMSLNLGFQAYYDDVSIDFKNYVNPNTNNLYRIDYGTQSYQETFLVKIFSADLRIGDFAFDATFLYTNYALYKSTTSITIISSSLNMDNLLFNFAYRKENSENSKSSKGRSKKKLLTALQYYWSNNVSTGVIYNNFLQNDITAQLIISF